MSATRLLILGVVRLLQPVHGYDVRRELLSWQADQWAHVAPGSIYHALRKLADEHLLEQTGTEQVGARPARTSYRVTALGEDEFAALLRRYLFDLDPPADPFLAAFSFQPALPAAESIAALRSRAQGLRGYARGMRSAFGGEWLGAKPPHVAAQLRRAILLAEADAGWCEETADQIESGELPSTG